jgi:hypothetical protein
VFTARYGLDLYLSFKLLLFILKSGFKFTRVIKIRNKFGNQDANKINKTYSNTSKSLRQQSTVHIGKFTEYIL